MFCIIGHLLLLLLLCHSIVHAQLDEANIGEPRIELAICKTRAKKGLCDYEFQVFQNNQKPPAGFGPTDCNSAQKNGYTFTRSPDDQFVHVVAPCSGMSIDTLKKNPQLTFGACTIYIGPICRSSTTT